MQRGGTDWEIAVTYTKTELQYLLEQILLIEKEQSATEQELGEHIARLKKLYAKELRRAEAHPVRNRQDFPRVSYKESTGYEYAPTGSPYTAEIDKLTGAAASNLAAYRALCLHAANLMDRKHQMIRPLHGFVTGILRAQRTPPSARGTPKNHPSRDVLLFALLQDIVERFSVTPTRNKATSSGMSACDIVAAAMPNDARLPKSYSALERIWIAGPEAERRSDELMSALLDDDLWD